MGACKRTEEQGGGRIFVRAKSNIGLGRWGYVYDLDQIELPKPTRSTWIARCSGERRLQGTAESLLAAAEVEEDDDTRNALPMRKGF